MLVDLYDDFAGDFVRTLATLGHSSTLTRVQGRPPRSLVPMINTDVPKQMDHHGASIRLLVFIDESVRPPQAYIRMSLPGSDHAWFRFAPQTKEST